MPKKSDQLTRKQKEKIIETRKRLQTVDQILGQLLDHEISPTQASQLITRKNQLDKQISEYFMAYIQDLPFFRPKELLRFLREIQGPWERLALKILNIPKYTNKLYLLPENHPEIIQRTMKRVLTNTEYQILDHYYGLYILQMPSTFEEIALDLNLPLDRIKMRYKKAIYKLRRTSLLDYLLYHLNPPSRRFEKIKPNK